MLSMKLQGFPVEKYSQNIRVVENKIFLKMFSELKFAIVLLNASYFIVSYKSLHIFCCSCVQFIF
jgi:hypothetical protein